MYLTSRSLASGHHGLPVDGYSYHVQGSTITLIFYNYGLPLANLPSLGEIFRWVRDESTVHPEQETMGTMPRKWGDDEYPGDLSLLLFPERTMTWGACEDVVTALKIFYQDWENVALMFDVRKDLVKDVIGRGQIYMTPRSANSTS